MPKKITEQSLATTRARKLKEGRGQGSLGGYKPWFDIGEVPSRGNSHRPKGFKTGREYQLLSDGELYLFYILDSCYAVIDIREQYPLPIEETLEITKNLGIKHPVVPRTPFPNIMTTDFLVDMIDESNNIIQKAIAVKIAKDLDDPRTIKKLTIEQAYWQSKNIHFEIIVKEDIPKDLITNLELIRYHKQNSNITRLSPDLIDQIEHSLFAELEKNIPVVQVTKLLGQQFNQKESTVLAILYYLIANHRYSVDMYKFIDTSKPLMITRNTHFNIKEDLA